MKSIKRSPREIEEWIVSWLAADLKVSKDIFDDLKSPLDSYGVSSLSIVTMTGELEEWLGFQIDPVVAYDYPAIADLAIYLSESTPKNPND